MTPLPINAVGNIEFFTLKGDGPTDVKIKLTHDIPSSIHHEVREQIMNVLFGVFYEFMTDEKGLSDKGKVFRAGMRFQQNYRPPGFPPDDRGPNKPKPVKPSDPDGEIMRPVRELESILKKRG